MGSFLWLLRRFGARRLYLEPLKPLLLAAGVGLGVSVFLAIVYSVRTSVHSFEQGVIGLSGSGGVVVKHAYGQLDPKLLSPLLRQLSPHADYIAVLERTIKLNDQPLSVLGISGSDLEVFGQSFDDKNSGIIQLRVSDEKVKDLDLDLEQGDVVRASYRDQSFSVKIKVLPDFTNYENSLAGKAFLSLPDLQEISGDIDALDYLVLVPREELSASSFNLAVSKFESDLLQLSGDYLIDDERERKNIADNLLGAFRSNLFVLSLFALFVCAFVIFHTSQLSFISIKPEFSTLSLLGVTKNKLLFLLLSEFLLLGLVAVAIGLSLGYPLSNFAAQASLQTAQDHFLGDVEILALPRASLVWVYGGAIFVGIVTCLLGALVPAYRASRTAPIDSKVSSHSFSFDTQSSFLGLSISIVLLLSVLAYLALSFQSKALALLTSLLCLLLALCAAPVFLAFFVRRVLGPVSARAGVAMRLALGRVLVSGNMHTMSSAVVATSLALFIALAVMIGSFRAELASWIEYSVQADLFISPTEIVGSETKSAVSQALINKIETHPSVSHVSPYAARNLRYGEQSISMAGVDHKAADARGIYNYMSGGAPAASNQIIVNESFARKYGGTGKCIELNSGYVGSCNDLGTTAEYFKISGVFKDYSVEKGLIILDWESFAKRFELKGPDRLSIYLKDSNSAQELNSFLSNEIKDLPLVLRSNTELRRYIFEIFDRTFLITKALLLIVIIISVFGFSVAILQQILANGAEIRVLQLAGLKRRDFFKTFLFENLLVSIPGALVGIAAGLALAATLVYIVNPLSFGWSFPLTISLSQIAFVLIIFLICNSALSWIPYLIAEHRVSNSNLSIE